MQSRSNARLEEAQAGIKIPGRNTNNLRYADDTTLMAESEEELKSLLMKEKEESEKVGLKLNIQKTKIMASSPITSWQIDGETVETTADFIFLDSKIIADGDCSHEIIIFLFFCFHLFLLVGGQSLYNIAVGFVIHWHESAMVLHVFPIPIPSPTSLSTRFLWVFPVHQARALVSCIQPGLVICFTIDNIHVSMLFSQNIPPSPSPTESKSLFCTSVSLFLFCI